MYLGIAGIRKHNQSIHYWKLNQQDCPQNGCEYGNHIHKRTFRRLYDADPNSLDTQKETEVKNLKNFLKEIIVAREAELEAEKKGGILPHAVDFSKVRAEMEKVGVSIDTICCPSCGASVSLPLSGTNKKCEYRETMIFAKDLLDDKRH